MGTAMTDRRAPWQKFPRAGDHALLLLLALLCWAGTIHGGTVPLDTPWLLTNNGLLSSGSASSIPAIWTDLDIGTRLGLGAEYLPVRDMSVLLDFALYGDRWAGHHLSNLLLYMGSCSLFLFILGDLLESRWRAGIGAALFTLHPAHVESVAWLASRKDVLSLLFFMAAVLAFLRSSRPMLWATVLGICAYWSKNTAIALPPLLAALSIIHKGKSPVDRDWWLSWLPMAAAFGAGLWLTMAVGSDVRMFAEQRADTAAGMLAVIAQSWVEHLRILFWPTDLAVLYQEPLPVSLASPAAGAGLAAIAAALLGPALIWRRRPAEAIGLWWFGMGLLPVSQLVPIQNLVADRYLLLPSAGACLVLAAAWPTKTPHWLLAVPIASLAALGILTAARIPVWHSAESLWEDLCAKQPRESRGWTALAGHYTERGEWQKAEDILQQGMEALPGNPSLLQGEGLMYLERGDPEEAESFLRQALEAEPSLRKAGNNLAIILHRDRRSEEAEELIAATLVKNPIYPVGWNTLGAIQLDRNKLEEAEASFKEAARLAPGSASTLANLGNVSYKRGDWDQAAMWWRKCLEADPSIRHARNGLRELEKKAGAP
jgi:protein O-mannosyl-transferase